MKKYIQPNILLVAVRTQGLLVEKSVPLDKDNEGYGDPTDQRTGFQITSRRNSRTNVWDDEYDEEEEDY